LALAVLLAAWTPGIWGCRTSGELSHGSRTQIRPASDTARLVQNAAYLRQSNRVELAIKELEEAHAREPGNLEVLDALTQCYEDLGRYERARELYDAALQRLGSHPALENNRCHALVLAGRPDKAETCFREALAANPENRAARNNLGLLLCRQGKEAEALALWQEKEGQEKARQRLHQALAALGRKMSLPSGDGPVAAPAPPPASVKVASGPPALAVSGPLASRPLKSQPPVALAATAAASGHLARRVPHPSAETASATVSSPRVPPPVSSPSARMLEQEAMSKTTTAPTAALPSSLPVADFVPGRTPDWPPDIRLTAQELIATRLEVKNGSGAPGQARETRTLLSLEGFTVTAMGNHVDFGLEETVITHRPGAERVAQKLAQRFFPGARVRTAARLPRQVDVRVSLGRDLLQSKNSFAKLADGGR
jgi:hypothetical protein